MTHQRTHYGRRWYVGLDTLPYQGALGVSLRRLGGLHLRLYLGPWKLYAGGAAIAKEVTPIQTDP